MPFPDGSLDAPIGLDASSDGPSPDGGLTDGGGVDAPDDCVDDDADGQCANVDCNDRNPAIGPDAAELCDGVDNNCNDETDEGCDCVDGQERACGSDVGTCAAGTESCVGGRWQACEGRIGPATETCEGGGDEDCDGAVDEGCECRDGVPRACGTTLGVCSGGQQACVDGRLGPCISAVEPSTEVCDGGTDEDCDGSTDEGCECVNGATRACGESRGACEPGTETCAAGRWQPCRDFVGPQPERCEGLRDENCDGTVDEGCECVDGTMEACGTDVGVCSPGTRTCIRGAWGACSASAPGVERCDGELDEDCDGDGDEGCECVDGTSRACGVDEGVCSAGTQLCAEGAWGACSGLEPGVETCSPAGEDEDCDGVVDEGCAIVDLAVASQHACLAHENGSVSCFGYNNDGELGDGTFTQRTEPVAVMDLPFGVVQIGANGRNSCGLSADGRLACWGNNSSGALGNGSTEDSNVPGLVQGLDDVIEFAVGGGHGCAIRSNESLVCWGNNFRGQLGDGTNENRTVPTQVLGLTGVSIASQVFSVDASGGHTCASRPSDVLCWGHNFRFQLGRLPNEDVNRPRNVSGTSGRPELALGASFSCARRFNGRVDCWGDNGNGQIGDGSTIGARSSPSRVVDLDDAAMLVAGSGHACALRENGRVVCWGDNRYGQIGDDSRGDDRFVPTPVPGLTNVVQLASGGQSTCALRESGELLCWGRNHRGQLGDGTTEDRAVPTRVLGY
ncbi:MAG: MopE-related protein [Myxococcota bacterium]